MLWIVCVSLREESETPAEAHLLMCHFHFLNADNNTMVYAAIMN
jgi:hypothetical protein